MWSHSAQRGPCGGGGANFLLMMERRLLKMQMTLAAVGRRQCGRSQTCYILFFLFLFATGESPLQPTDPRRFPRHFVNTPQHFGLFTVAVGEPRGTMLTKQLYFHAVEIILVSLGIHAAINSFYFCLTPNSHLLQWETVPRETVCSFHSKYPVVVFSHFFPHII